MKTIKNYLGFITILLCLNLSANEPWSVRFANSEMERHPNFYGDWDYVTGTVLKGFEMIWRNSGDQKYFDYIKNTIDNVVNKDGKINSYRATEYNIDEVAEGRLLLTLYKETGEEKYKIAADSVRKQFDTHPRTLEGGFWHKQIYQHQMWLDGLYMGSPFYAEYTMMFNRTDDFSDITKQFLLIKKHLCDSKTGLFYHAWDESKQMFWADKETGLSKCFWGRGNGWYIMALVDVLDFLPPDHPDRKSLIEIVNGLCAALKKFQDEETGLWWQVVDQANRFGNYFEASASSMFVYGIAKAVRMGYIDPSYYQVAKKGFDGIINHLIIEDMNGNLSLGKICLSAGLGGNYMRKVRDGSYEYYVFLEPVIPNDGKGTGPFLMACVEIEMAESK